MDQPKSRWIPAPLQPWLAKPWVKALIVIAVFAILGVIFMLTSDRKDSAYWAGYTDGQRWVDAGGYAAHEETISAYCASEAAQKTSNYQRGCVDGAHNAMK